MANPSLKHAGLSGSRLLGTSFSSFNPKRETVFKVFFGARGAQDPKLGAHWASVKEDKNNNHHNHNDNDNRNQKTVRTTIGGGSKSHANNSSCTKY